MSIKIENIEVFGWRGALRGARMPFMSHKKADSYWTYVEDEETLETAEYEFFMGENDHGLAMKLSKGGPVHGKFMRMVHVQMDVTANHVWWAEMDTYKVGTTRNSQSKMHLIHIKPFEWDDFSHEGCDEVDYAREALAETIATCERLRLDFNTTHDKKYWRALIELLPMGYNLTATIDLTYEVLANIYYWRRGHKMFEWHIFCDMIESLPYSELITCRVKGLHEDETADSTVNEKAV